MMSMVVTRVLRVFVDEAGRHGNPLGVVLDAATVIPDPFDRQLLARRLGFSETVFVDDVEKAELRIYGPDCELPLVGHPLVGAAWLLARLYGEHPTLLRPPGGEVASWVEDGRVWIRGPLAATPPWWHERLPGVADVEAYAVGRPSVQDLVQVWAWDDEPASVVRARAFAARLGIAEDEACGSATMRLAAALGRRLTVRHGVGSLVLAQSGPPGHADVGGLVVEESARTVEL
jgi:predicted PhzF superfamily epimerase YddE/YHI9